MSDKFRTLLTGLVSGDEELVRLAGLMNIILIAIFFMSVVTTIGIVLFIPDQLNNLGAMFIFMPLVLVLLFLVRRGFVRGAIKVFTVSLWIMLSLITIVLGSIQTPAFTSYIIVILIAGLLWSGRAGLIFTLLAISLGLLVALVEESGLIYVADITTSPLSLWIGQTANFLLVAFFLYQTRESLNNALTRARNEVGIRKEVESALRQGEMQLRHVVDTVPEGVLLLDNDGRINLANPVANNHLAVLALGRTEENKLQILGDKTLEELLVAPPEGLWHEVTAQDYLFEAIARPVENTTTNQGWVMVLRDVTQEREIQRQIQQQERLAAVGQLAAGIAHDFNNIMAVIILYTQMISRQDDLKPYVSEKIETIRQQGQRAADLIQQILDFSRQSVLDQQPLEAASFLEEIVNMLRRTLRENINIQLDRGQGDYLIYVDPSRIQQVLLNLAVNARDAMPGGGELSISLEEIEVDNTEIAPLPNMISGSWIVIHVSDTGSGISQEVLSRIFEPFYSTKDVGKGTGLGLAQVYGIMKQHAGHLDVRSEVNAGSTFSLYFPAYTQEMKVNVKRTPSKLPLGQGQTILLVEDNQITREAIVDSLEMLNYTVVQAENGRYALEILSQRKSEIDLIITDAVMPEMGGIALLKAVRRENSLIPVIILTGHPLTGELDHPQEEGLSYWLLKPPSLEEIANILTDLLNPQA